jgi:hypothetical protein
MTGERGGPRWFWLTAAHPRRPRLHQHGHRPTPRRQPQTIRNHVSNILSKLHATDRQDATRIASDAGLTPRAGPA